MRTRDVFTVYGNISVGSIRRSATVEYSTFSAALYHYVQTLCTSRQCDIVLVEGRFDPKAKRIKHTVLVRHGNGKAWWE